MKAQKIYYGVVLYTWRNVTHPVKQCPGGKSPTWTPVTGGEQEWQETQNLDWAACKLFILEIGGTTLTKKV